MAASRSALQTAASDMVHSLMEWFDAEITTIRTAIERATRIKDDDVVLRVAQLEAVEQALAADIARLQPADPAGCRVC